MTWSAHCLFAHLTLVHVPRRLVIIRKRSQTRNKTKHIRRIQLLVGRNPLPNILRKASNIHKRLLHRPNIFRPSRSPLKHRANHSCRNGKQEQSRIRPTFHTRGNKGNFHRGRNDRLLQDFQRSQLGCNRLAKLGGRSADDSPIHHDWQVGKTGNATSVSTLASGTRWRHAPRNQQFVQILQLSSRGGCWIGHVLTLQCHVTQEPTWTTIGCMHRTEKPPLIRQQLPHGRGLHLKEELPTMNTTEVCTKSQEIELFGHNRVATHLHQIQTCRGNDISRREKVLHLLSNPSRGKVPVAIDNLRPPFVIWDTAQKLGIIQSHLLHQSHTDLRECLFELFLDEGT
mmetsp:Transcript_31069/g.56365  ORF Transcript_31069/g.56365 Transcript_31069/m.56365 type:complete len:342 (-) Transcript_31069:1482-2507(-)